MKKGFTLVELAIVLVVIGLLLGMAFKGKSLVDAARIKADVNKIEKMGTAINVYYAKYDTLPGIHGDLAASGNAPQYTNASSGGIYQTLINEGLLKASDFKSAAGATYWQFTGCSHDPSGWVAAAISESTNLCIYRSTQEPTKATKAAIAGDVATNASVSGVSICQFETLLDDKDAATGDGRTITTAGSGKPLDLASKVDTKNWNCASTTGTDMNSISNEKIAYMYRVF